MSTEAKIMIKKINAKKYAAFLEQLKKGVREAPLKSRVSVNF